MSVIVGQDRVYKEALALGAMPFQYNCDFVHLLAGAGVNAACKFNLC